MTEQIIFGLAGIVVLGVGAQWLAWRLRLPSILLLLLFGFTAGPITGLLDPDLLFGRLLFPIVSISVAIILFEGGLTLQLSELPRVGDVVFRLISIGAIVTWALAAVAAHYLLEMDWALSVLIGAILIVTGPTVIAPLLRQIRPKGKVGAALKWEGILIDPVGAVLAVLVFEAILGGELSQAPGVIFSGVLRTLVIGFGLGIAAAVALIFFLRRFLIPDHLENGVSLLTVVSVFAISNWLHPESGLLTVIVVGTVLANQRLVSVKHIVEFKENLQVLLVGGLFILLSARLDPAVLLDLGWMGVAFLAVLIVIGRPLAVLLSTLRSELTQNERLFMAFMAPRGIVAAAVASVFAFELAEAGHPGAEEIVSIIFLVIVGTVSFYGLAAGPIARRLGLAELDPQGVLIVGAHKLARAIAQTLTNHNFRVMLLDTNWDNIQHGRMEGLETHYGNAYSEDVLEDLELTGIGRLLAMTPNNEVNSLAALHFPELFSRAEVYQLPVKNWYERESPIQPEPPQHLTGRYLFGSEMTYNFLTQRMADGAVVKATPITEQFTYEDFQAQYDHEAIPLFLISPRKQLLIYTTDKQPVPRPGSILISLVDPEAAVKPDEEKADLSPEMAV